MDPPCPPHWTFAARAAYFGDRMCAFCDHRNPPGAKFCNDCASPLHLKPCNQCDAINDQAATNCHNCGAPCRMSFDAFEPTPVLPSPDPASAPPRTDITVPGEVTQRAFTNPTSERYWRLLRPKQFLMATMATIVVAGVYAAYFMNMGTRDGVQVARQEPRTPEQNEPVVEPALAMTLEPLPIETSTFAVLLEPLIPPAQGQGPERATVRQRPAHLPATMPATGLQRLARERQTPPGTTARTATRRPDTGSRGVRVANSRRTTPPARWQAMHVSLARCEGDLFARIICDQRVRWHYCEGHWGKATECPRGIANDHGQ